MIITTILFVFGFIFLIKGADMLVEGASAIAKAFGLSAFFIGLTIVAFGTSAPELIVSTIASVRGSSGIALGNIIGSNITNTLLILGVAAIIAPLAVKRATVNKEIPFSLLAIFAVGLLVNDFLIDRVVPSGLTRIDGLVLILFFSIFVYYTFGMTKDRDNIYQKTVGMIKQEESKDYSLPVSVFMIALGLAGLVIGGRWIVNGAIFYATTLGLSETLIGLTVVALGTSLPELAASAVSAYKGRTDIAVGNVVGSNIFNLLLVLGISSTISPIGFNLALNADILILVGVTVLLLVLIYNGNRNVIGRGEGIILLSTYAIYIMYIIIRG